MKQVVERQVPRKRRLILSGLLGIISYKKKTVNEEIYLENKMDCRYSDI
jgi:hypothetical protein